MDTNIWFNLSESQLNIWDLEQRYKGTPMNVISCAIEIFGRVDFSLLEQTLNEVLASDDSLRLQIRADENGPMQRYVPYGRQQFVRYDFTQSGRDAFEKWKEMAAREPLPLCESPLCQFFLFRLGEHEGGIFVRTHHIISDGWTQTQLCKRIAARYMELIGASAAAMDTQPSYQLHIENEQAYLESYQKEQDVQFWRELLAKDWEPACIKQEKSAVSSLYGMRVSYGFSELLNHKIYRFCMENRVSPFTVYYLALAAYLNRSRNLTCFSIGVPVYNRVTMEERQMTGMFVSTLPFVCEFDPEQTMEELTESVAEQWFDLLRHQRLPLHELQQLLVQQEKQRDRMFHLVLSYEDMRMLEHAGTQIRFGGNWYYSGYQAEQLCIHLHNRLDEQHYQVDYDFLLQMFSESEIRRLHMTFVQILDELLDHVDRSVNELHLMGTQEREKVLYTFNDTKKYMADRSLREVFAETVKKNPSKVAVICQGERFTYETLYRQGMQLAQALGRYLAVEQPVIAILLDREYALYQTMAAAMLAGCPWVLLSAQYPKNRIQEILKECQASVIVSRGSLLEELHLSFQMPIWDMDAAFSETEMAVSDSKEKDLEQQGSLGNRDGFCGEGSSLAYLVYTSGTTGRPKGVAVRAEGLINFATAMDVYYGNRAVLSVCNVCFDAFVIESAAALLDGRTIVLPNEQQLQDARALADLIRGYGVGFLSVTPSRLKVWMRETKFCDAMCGLQTIICGGEPFPSALTGEIAAYSAARIFNQYGPSEATVGVSLKQMNDCSQITVGVPMQNCKMYVLNEKKKPLPIGARGKLYLGGICLAAGYYRDDKATAERFVENPFEWKERMYDTGDEAAWTESGEIVLFGRTDRQIKLRGLRIDLTEVVGSLEEMEQISAAYVKLVVCNGQDCLAAYYTAKEPLSEGQIRKFLAERLPGYMIPAFYQWMQVFQVTANGKIDETALPVPQMKVTGGAAQTKRQQILLDIFRESLSAEMFGMETDYFRQGGNSLGGMEVISRVNALFETALKPSDLYTYPTPALLDGYLAELLGQEQLQSKPVIQPAPDLSAYPMTATQQNMYVQAQLDPGSFAYHMPGMFRLERAVDRQRLQQALCLLAEKDDILRTGFCVDVQGPAQVIEKQVAIEVWEISAESQAEALEQFLRPFDLAKPPLVHCGLWNAPDGGCYLLLDMHHIIGDGISTALFLQRLDQCYQTEQVSMPTLTFKDYAYWMQTEGLQESLLSEWEKELDEMPPLLLLPADGSRSVGRQRKGAHYTYEFSTKVSAACGRFCKETGYSEYVLFAAAFGLLLKKVGQVDDLIIGTPLSGRTLLQTQDICGPFVTTLPLRIRPADQLTADAYLRQTQKTVQFLLDHDSVTLESLIQMKQLERTVGGNPLYQILFSMRPLDVDGFSFDGQPVVYEPVDVGAAKMELSLEAAKTASGYQFVFEYDEGIFFPETVAYYGKCLEQLTEALMQGAETACVQEVTQIPAFDQIACFEAQNARCLPFADVFIDRMIARVVAKAGETPAVIWQDQVLTYREFWNRVVQMSAWLSAQGIVPGAHVGMIAKRTPDLLAALIAVIRLGAVYVPALSSFPIGRLQKMEQIGQIQIWIGDDLDAVQEKVQRPAVSFPDKWGENWSTADAVCVPSEVKRKTTDPMYLLFTSGSTGDPKGVSVTHRGIHNLSENIRYLVEEQDGPILCTTNFVFDTFYTETLLPLRYGKTVILADEEEMLLPWKIGELAERYRPALMQMTPSRLNVCLDDRVFAAGLSHVTKMVVAGEALTEALVKKIQQVTEAELINLYGPAEASVYATGLRHVTADRISIGKPLYNCRAYCLDAKGCPVVPGAVGELYLAGECLGDGYAQNPELTAALFTEDPFVGYGRMYRTKDLVRYLPDGNLEFIGRTDFQIKLHGQRLEPEEIAVTIRRCAAVRQAAVVPVVEEQQVRSLRAFYELTDAAKKEKLPEAQIQRQIIEVLEREVPRYMHPSEYICLPQLPLNANGKIDRQALLSGQRQNNDCYLESEKDAGTRVCRQETPLLPVPEVSEQADTDTAGELLVGLWRQVLRRDEIPADVSFFQLGGTSLAAMQLLSCYYDKKLSMTMEQFYQYQTLEEQQAFFFGQEMFAEQSAPDKSGQIDDAHSLDGDFLSAKQNDRKTEGAILFSGSTGFLGAHILDALLRRRKERIICLVRPASLKKVYNVWAYYFGACWVEQALERVTLQPFDLSAKDLGLADDVWNTFRQQVTAVYHCAADVRHFCADDQIMKTNYEGTAHMLTFAKTAGATFHHISTLSVGGSFLRGCPNVEMEFDEADFEIGQNWQENAYVRSKFMAEALVRDAMKQGLTAKIYRVGTLVGRAADGKFQQNPETNAFYQNIAGIGVLGALPEALRSRRVDLTPVDVCGDAIVCLADSRQTTFHLMGEVYTIEDLCCILRPEIRFCETTDLSAEEMKGNGSEAARGMLQIRELLARLQEQEPKIVPVAHKTEEALRECGFTWEPADPRVLLREFQIGGIE